MNEREEFLAKAIHDIIEANNAFREGMPKDWDGDPLQDAINEGAKLLLTGVAQKVEVPSKDDLSASVSRELHMDQILTLARELGAVTEKLIASEQAYRQLERKAAKERRRLQSASQVSSTQEKSP